MIDYKMLGSGRRKMVLNRGENSKRSQAGMLVKHFSFLAAFILLPILSEASQINNVSIQEAETGDVVRVEADEQIEYQVFDLDGPPRIVLSFPGASMASSVKAIKVEGKGVTGIFPESNQDGARLEIGLSEATDYKIDENGNDLIITLNNNETAGERSSSAIIEDIEVRESGDYTELVLRGINMDANHNAFLTNQNKTLFIDFWGGSSKLPKENYKYSNQWVNGVTVGESDGRVRLVVDLVPTGSKLNQQIDASANQMVVRLGNVMPAKRAEEMVVESVDFQPDGRIAHITLRTDAVNPIVNIKEKDGNVVIDLKKARLAPAMERSQDVRAFSGPIKQIDSYSLQGAVRVVARLREKADVTTYQQGNVVTVNFEPEDVKLARMGSKDDGRSMEYSGQNVTFDFKNIEITNALKLISEMSDLNIIMSDDVTGTLTMRLVDVPWDQALDLILTTQGLGKQLEGNVMRIAPIGVLRKEHKEALEGIKDVAMLEPLITEPISLNFARVSKIESMLKESMKKAQSATISAAVSGSASGDGNTTSSGIATSIFSPRGTFIVDERTNTLIVTDTEQGINNVKRFISIVDKSVEQVLIEARIIEATSTFTEEFGIRWGGMFTDTPNVKFPSTVSIGAAGGPGAANRMIVDLPAPSAGPGAGGAIGLSLGSLTNFLNIDLELSAAEIEGLAKVVSTPRVLTTNGGKAEILQGVEVPFITPASGNSPATVSFKQAVLKLEVTPQITANRTVIMAVEIKNDSPTGLTVQGNPILQTKKVNTNLQVKDGETIVIGGVFSKSDADNEAGVPGVKDVPILGWLFKTKQKLNNKTELLIFLTPKIVNSSAGSEESAGRS